MRYFIILFSLLVIDGCSKTPTDPPVGSFRDIQFQLDMSDAIIEGEFDVDTHALSVLLDSSNEFQMVDNDDDGIFLCTIPNLILGRTYPYQYMINDTQETLDGERSVTVSDYNDILDYYGELNPTTLTFLVDMSYQIELNNFNLNTNSLDIVGDLNSWNGQEMILSDGSENIYEIMITDIEVGEEIIYKFRIDDSGWESPNPDISSCIEDGYSGYNRFHVVEEGEHILSHQFNDEYGE
jgi:hypothetical protein